MNTFKKEQEWYSKVAIFIHKGDCSKLGQTYDYIYQTWFPSSGHSLRNAPCFDEYLDREDWITGKKTMEENLTKIYLPIE